jgi:hypothetical protein
MLKKRASLIMLGKLDILKQKSESTSLSLTMYKNEFKIDLKEL